MNKGNIYRVLVLLLLTVGCSKVEEQKDTLFEAIPSSYSGVDFSNDLEFDEAFNIFTYRNFYNGGGVALGDVNGDGLLDIYLTSNQGENKLYLNEGDFKFKDVTTTAGVAGKRAWSTGVAMADVNGDGLLDIYVCNSGDLAGDNKQNELFINNGDGTFTEMAESYGLADQGYSTHAVFFDFDNDGDLDLYLLNNSYTAIGSFNKMQNERPRRDPVGGDKLFRNDGDRFVDVSEEAGIYGSLIGFGLGITIGDVNQDGWMDIFISNDFFEKDYLYINNQDGTFTESLETYMRSISAASMGADIADVNNNGFLDIFVTDMLPEPLERLKQVTTFENWDKFQFNRQHGYYNQFNRNMFHVNNGDGTFSEVGRMGNMEATDWSWAALFFDMDNDGLKDVFVANGIYQDITDLDYLNFIDNEETKRKIITQQGVNYKALVDPIPVTPVSNYAFKNQGDLVFTNVIHEWGMGDPIHSNGSAYGDLNNDGALDLVINNVNQKALIYKNRSREFYPNNHYLQIQIKGKNANTQAIGTQVRLLSEDQIFYQELMPNRGFQSSVDPKLTFGLGSVAIIDEIQVRWPDGQVTVLKDISANQLLEIDWEEAEELADFDFFQTTSNRQFEKVDSKQILDFTHVENPFVDFDRDRLTYHKLSTEGPAFAFGDVNGDGLEDVFIGGAKGQAGQLFLQQANGSFKALNNQLFETDKNAEDTDALFFDANGNGFLDLYVASGSSEASFSSLDLTDRLYLNDGKGSFSKATGNGLENFRYSTSVVQTIDVNGDGALDLFLGARLVPFVYGVNASSLILINDGKGNFSDQTAQFAPALKDFGLVTDAVVVDYDQDGLQDLIVVGEWMEPNVFKNTGHQLERIEIPELAGFKGWYRTIEVGDFNNDGLPDFVLGNHGLNSRFKPSLDSPIKMFVNDFDQNGTVEQIFTKKVGEQHAPYILKHELEKQIPSIKKKYLKYSNYNKEMLEDIFEAPVLANAVVQEFNYAASAIMLNQGSGKFTIQQLPRMAQRSWIFAAEVVDIDGDGHQDLILGGNLKGAKPEVGQYDASYGEVLLGNGDGTFRYWENRQHGLQLHGDIRGIKVLESHGQRRLMIVKNNDAVEWWKF
ncbi:VCBS repeat-containing protein [Belliella pelovolcani]|uniref:Repeat domain-containing protein n=1 Tax=Belliella pelovolcani TaxID=529505 RepID=A0A1N7M2J5_9BACT|nr:VCBS repeat-containing protein [Belliella pelovolcani]SIS80209.1 Repeat domain-containing protein [Belliella pelovolcani]